jgi:hypothetical protein
MRATTSLLSRGRSARTSSLHLVPERVAFGLQSAQELRRHCSFDNTGERSVHRLHLAKHQGAVGLHVEVPAPYAVHEELVPTQSSPTEPLVDHQLGHSIVDRASFPTLTGYVDLDFAAYPQLARGRDGVPIPVRVAVKFYENLPDFGGRSVDRDFYFMTPHVRCLDPICRRLLAT